VGNVTGVTEKRAACALSAAQTEESLETNLQVGLSSSSATQRLTEFGYNELTPGRVRGILRTFVSQFHNPLIYVLLAAAAVTLAIGETVDTMVIVAVVLVNSVVGFIQEWRAGQALSALAALTKTRASVLRNGQVQRIPSTELVPGDIVMLDAGDQVPADLRLTTAHELQIDEASLTGESVPVHKNSLTLPADTPLGDQTNMAFSGTLVTAGRGVGIAIGTGHDTEMGRIHGLVESAEGVQTPLTKQLTRLSGWLTFAIIILALISVGIGLLRGETFAEMVLVAVALAVSAIPEGLPAVVTITLAIGVSRMAQRNAIVRKLPAVETLGSTTIICTDKTGTLTENNMTVQFIFVAGVSIPLETIIGVTEHRALDCLIAGIHCNDASVGNGADNESEHRGDPTELALISAAQTVDATLLTEAPRWKRIQEIPFASELRFMATLHTVPKESSKDGVEERLIVVKGAAEDVVSMCDLDEQASAAVNTATDQFASNALRVLAFAWLRVPSDFDLTLATLREQRLEFLGLQAMMDPPRKEVTPAIKACQTAGISVRMITGDHRRTAEAIANLIGLRAQGDLPLHVATGKELAATPPDELSQRILETHVFARVTAEQKLRIVETFQEEKNVVAMTGDGVNDAPALKQADIGVAMGMGGTDVAKETAEVILTDDNFATIEAAVEEGRGVFDNLTKFIQWTLPTNLGEALVILSAILIGSTLPILPVQILWINMTTAVALGLMLAFEPKEAGIMERPPRLPHSPIITRRLLAQVVVVASLMTVAAFTLFHLALDNGASLEQARTISVNAFVAMEIGYLFNCRSLRGSLLSVGVFSNKWIWVGITAMVFLQILFTFAPFMNAIFSTEPPPTQAWWAIIGVGIGLAVIMGGVKWADKKLHRTE
jgi:cation-transporting P-type ATPase F